MQAKCSLMTSLINALMGLGQENFYDFWNSVFQDSLDGTTMQPLFKVVEKK